MFLTEQEEGQLREKWAPIMEHEDLSAIQNSTKRDITIRLLENQEKQLKEDAVTTGNVSNWDPVLISLVRRSTPQLLAYDTVGVQPMTGPTGLVFYMKSYYTNTAGNEALTIQAGKPDVTHSGPMSTADGETLGGFNGGTNQYGEMSFGIEKTSVEAKTRALKAKYSNEIAHDLKVIHGLDAESELASILSNEIIAETNWELMNLISSEAKVGAQASTIAGTFDLADAADNKGARWGGERYKALITQINKEANIIARETGRGAGNFIICSADVASILDMTANLATDNAQVTQGMNLDINTSLFAGVLGGKYKVFVNPYLAADEVIVGYKGASEMDAGLFYCPYVPLQMYKSTGEEDFQPRIGFKSRYGIMSNPFAGSGAGANQYYRKFNVANL
jgi:hypothetical protein